MPRKAKWKSTTLWVTAWAMAVVSYLLWKQPNVVWAGNVITMCSAIIMVYVGGNKAVDFKHGPEMEKDKGQ